MRVGFAIALALIAPLTVSAQMPAGVGGTGETFTVSISPQYPTSYSTASLSALSNTLDLTGATMSVVVSGKTIYTGSVQPVSIPLGKAGNVTTALVNISLGGATYKQTVSITPQDVALVAEPLSSTPPLYPGKSLVPLSGDTRVVAAASLASASGRVYDPATLAYAWSVDGTRIADSSGVGKSALVVASPLQYRNREVSVVVTSPDGQAVGGASLSLVPVEPSVRIYATDPLLGILFDHALVSAYSITSAESTLYGAPFSLPTSARAPLITWFLNGAAAQSGSSITLRPSGSGQGSASLSLTAASGDSTASTNLSLIFGSAPSSNFFGL